MILDTVQWVAEETLPVPAGGGGGGNQLKKSPGWKEVVKPFKEEAYFWHQVWKSCGRPLNTVVHQIMKKTRNRYHYEYKKICKSEAKIKGNKLLESCINGESDLFTELKIVRRSKSVVASSMDGVTENLEEHFKNKY